MNSSNVAISVVQAPDSCSSIPFTTASGSTPPDRAHNAIAVALCCGLRVDFERIQARHGFDGCDLVGDTNVKSLADIGGGVGADQQDAFAGFGKTNC